MPLGPHQPYDLEVGIDDEALELDVEQLVSPSTLIKKNIINKYHTYLK